MHENLYFETVKHVLDTGIEDYCKLHNVSHNQVDQGITAHIVNTSTEHRNPDPDIDYSDPLCRLGYLFVHAGVNATLFELTIQKSSTLSTLVESHANESLSICAVGGGPGTELLSLAKFALTNGSVPADIEFAVLDYVPAWSESWGQLARAIQDRLRQELDEQVTIHRTFLPIDVTSPGSYLPYASLFAQTDLFVYNYLLSENQVYLGAFQNALNEMVKRAPEGCLFVIIDRIEYDSASQFQREDVVALIGSCDLEVMDNLPLGGCISDNESALAPYPARFHRRPRRWYRTETHHYPTAFAIVARKPVT